MRRRGAGQSVFTGPQIRGITSELDRPLLTITEFSGHTGTVFTPCNPIQLVHGHCFADKLLKQRTDPINSRTALIADSGHGQPSCTSSEVRRAYDETVPTRILVNLVAVLDPQLSDSARPLTDSGDDRQLVPLNPFTHMLCQVIKNEGSRSRVARTLGSFSAIDPADGEAESCYSTEHLCVRFLRSDRPSQIIQTIKSSIELGHRIRTSHRHRVVLTSMVPSCTASNRCERGDDILSGKRQHED